LLAQPIRELGRKPSKYHLRQLVDLLINKHLLLDQPMY